MNTELERQYKELLARNNQNENENFKLQVKREEAIKRIKDLINNSEVQLDIDIDYENLVNSEYVSDLVNKITKDIDDLEASFDENLKKAQAEIS